MGPNAGGEDAIVSKFDATGALVWMKQFGTGAATDGNGIATDNPGNIYVAGGTTGALTGSNFGYFDGFLMKLNVVPERRGWG